ncbi:sensor histidine kinase, partial [Planctomycetota bacterium]
LEKRKNDMLDVLGHDLRAPLNIVKQNIVLLTDFIDQPDKIPTGKRKEFMAACKRHIDRMEKLINKVLDVRQLETGKIVLKKDQTSTNKVLDDAGHSLDSWAQDKQITIDIAADPLPDIYCDPERIYQVITNLISNALKFTPEGGHIQVSGKTVDGNDGQAVEISVADSGMGIKEEDLKRIFNKYEQVSLQHPKGVSGLGLGLSICKTIVEMHGGTIWATSRVNEGSTFSFQIPVTHDAIESEAVHTS